jgi:hypothetical protein
VTAEAIERVIIEERLDMPFDLQALDRAGDGGRVPMAEAGALELLPFARLAGVRSKADSDEVGDGRFACELVELGRFSDGSTLCWAQRNGGPEILFVRRVPGTGDWIVVATLLELVESLLERSRGAPSVDAALRKRKTRPY